MQVPSLYREELHLPEMFDLFFGRDLLDLIMSLTSEDLTVYLNDVLHLSTILALMTSSFT